VTFHSFLFAAKRAAFCFCFPVWSRFQLFSRRSKANVRLLFLTLLRFPSTLTREQFRRIFSPFLVSDRTFVGRHPSGNYPFSPLEGGSRATPPYELTLWSPVLSLECDLHAIVLPLSFFVYMSVSFTKWSLSHFRPFKCLGDVSWCFQLFRRPRMWPRRRRSL